MKKPDTTLHKNKIAIVGNPNVGKSALFNQITESYSLVANAPYTTVSVSRADIVIDGVQYEIIDTPGIMSLDVQSEDGLVSRSIIMREHPELLVACVDTNNLQRSLTLLSQFIEIEIPMVVCLNFVDESRRKGIFINLKKLEELLGVPVIETVASEGRGVRELMKAIPRAAVPGQRVRYLRFIEEGLDALDGCFPEDAAPPDAVLLLLLMQDSTMESFIASRFGPDILTRVREEAGRVRARSQKDITRLIPEARREWAGEVSRIVLQAREPKKRGPGEAFGRLSRHPVYGWIVLAAVVYLTYLLVGEVGANYLALAIDEHLFQPLNGRIAAVIPWPLLEEFLLGDYGILTTGLENAIGTVLPILTMFFLILNTLEDIGYIPNLSVLCNRLFQKVGLSGKAILPVVLGFGCKTMATLATKILESKKERYIAVFLIAFAIPCSSQLGINLAILALLPFSAFLIVFGVLIAVEIAAGLILNRLLEEKQQASDFIMELPPIRIPNLKSLLLKTYYRLKWFLMEAVPLFVIGALILYLMDKVYLLGLIKKFVFPVVVQWLNLPIATVDAFLLCIARHEAGAVILLDLVHSGSLDYIQTIVSIIIVTCFVPCFANIMAMIKELGLKSALLMTLVIIVSSVMIGAAVNYALRAF